MNALSIASLIGLAFFFIVEFVRALPWPEKWKYVKPLSCSTCMVGWCVVVAFQALMLRGEWTNENALTVAAAAGFARLALALKAHFEPELPPPPT